MTDVDAVRRRIAAAAAGFGLTGVSVAAVTPAAGPVTFATGTTTDGTPVDAHTPFSVASSGKHATAVAVLALAQAGRLNLDDPIGAHLADVPRAWADRSIASLLHHTSGLPEYLAYRPDEDVPTTRADFMARYASLVPAFDQDAAWCYANTNYILLGLLVAALDGTTYVDALRTRVFAPGACDEVAAGGPEVPPAPTIAESLARVEAIARPRAVAGDGDLVLSAHGALAWDRMLAGDAVLGPAMRAALIAPRTLTTGRTVPYGCGWFVDRVAGRDCHHHAGHFGGWTAFFLRVPAAGAAVYLMTNVALGNTRAQRFLAQEVLEALAPGTTPLGLPAIVDDDPALTHATRDALIRRDGAPAELDRLAPELRLLVERVGGIRSALNLWCGEEPLDMAPVEGWSASTERYRRYRLRYAARVEHVLVGYAADDRIHWAWPM